MLRVQEMLSVTYCRWVPMATSQLSPSFQNVFLIAYHLEYTVAYGFLIHGFSQPWIENIWGRMHLF